jgi:hypothetical protein
MLVVIFAGVRTPFLQKVKKKSVILSVVSVFLIILFMVGSTGAVIVKHTCLACGLSEFHTEFYSSELSHDGCSCDNITSSCHSEDKESLEPGCCTFQSDKLSLADYTTSKLVNIVVISLPSISLQSVLINDIQVKPEPTIIIHNKHGGRDLLRSVCQLLI